MLRRLNFSGTRNVFGNFLYSTNATNTASQIRGLQTNEHGLRLCDIIGNITIQTSAPLVPEIKLHLITSQCKLWRSPPEDCPVSDPYWAFFWPGGQALCRYLLDNPWICKNKTVLDIGSGSGALSIAAALCGAASVVANDIDPVANEAMKMNIRLNNSTVENKGLEQVRFHGSDILPADFSEPLKEYLKLRDLVMQNTREGQQALFNVVLVGDMCYDEDVASKLFLLLRSIQLAFPESTILLGDPGRHGLSVLSDHVEIEKEYALPVDCDWGFPSSRVYRFVGRPPR